MVTTPYMFASVPAGRASLRAAYEAWLKAQTPLGSAEPTMAAAPVAPQQLRVGIAGGGMAGLYAALLLQARGVRVHVFEAHPSRLVLSQARSSEMFCTLVHECDLATTKDRIKIIPEQVA